MTSGSVHIAQRIECPAARTYAYARDPTNLPAWAAGLGGASIEHVDGQWRVPTPDGHLVIELAPRNGYGVLDHTVRLPDGTTVDNPMRVIPDGDACEVVFTLRRRPSTTDTEFEDDAAAVARDLLTLKRILESSRTD